MANQSDSSENHRRSRRPSGTTPEARERQLISLAVDAAERQLREGTASAQVITHYLRLGSTREQLEQERIAQEVELMKSKQEAMASAKNVEELYKTALTAMRTYAGFEESNDED